MVLVKRSSLSIEPLIFFIYLKEACSLNCKNAVSATYSYPMGAHCKELSVERTFTFMADNFPVTCDSSRLTAIGL
jgi:hypothetical protein